MEKHDKFLFKRSIRQKMINHMTWALDALLVYRRHVYIATAVLAIAFAGIFILDNGNWTRSEVFHGPFQIKPSEASQYRLAIGTDIPYLKIPNPQIERGHTQDESKSIQLWVNGVHYKPSRVDAPTIDQGKLWGITGIDRHLEFTLPAGVANISSTVLRVTYPIEAQTTPYDIIKVTFLLFLFLSIGISYRVNTRAWRDAWSRSIVAIFNSLQVIFRLLTDLTLVSCSLYFASVVYGTIAGDALPTATIFRLVPGRVIESIEPYLPIAVLLVATLGTVFGWGASLSVAAAACVRETERRLRYLWGWCGLPVIFAFFLLSLSAGGWSHHVRQDDVNNYVSIAGLIPHSDAYSYYSDAFRLAMNGSWIGERSRPLGLAFRQLTVMAGGYNYVGTLLVQAGLLSAALFLAGRGMTRWYGLWAGIGFVGLIYILVRPFLVTTLTEPLGLILVMLSLSFLLDALRLRSLPHALIAVGGTTAALFVRMGDMFLIPILVLWIGFAFASENVRRLRHIAVAAGIVLLIVVLNSLVAMFYAQPGSVIGGNFAWVACGLSIGRDWSSCYHIVTSTLNLVDKHATDIFLFKLTWQNILSDPSIILWTLVQNAQSYVHGLPIFVFEGYNKNIPIKLSDNQALLLLVTLFVSALYVNYRRSSLIEISFGFFFLSALLRPQLLCFRLMVGVHFSSRIPWSFVFLRRVFLRRGRR